ncbi:MAG: glycosyltransferase family 4 protein [Halobacteriota archaeon]
MKVLLVNWMDTTAPGGINTVVRETGTHLAQKGDTITVLQPNSRHLAHDAVCNGFSIRRVEAPLNKLLYGFDVRLWRDLRALYGQFNPDVIHVHGYHSLFGPEAAFMLRLLDRDAPLVFSYHLDVYRERFWARRLWNTYKILGKKIARSATHIIAFSRYEAEVIAHEFDAPPDRLSIIPHGVEAITAHTTRSTCGGPRLLYVGHLIKRKNVHSVVESLNVLVHRENVQGASLTIVGSGPEHARLRHLIRERGLEDHVTMRPFLATEDLRHQIRSADVLLLLSNSEAFGIVVAEALALGTPCIVADATALHEFVTEPGCFGVGCPPNPEEVAQRIMEVCRAEVRVGPFSDRLRTWDDVAEDYARVYARCVSDARGPSHR